MIQETLDLLESLMTGHKMTADDLDSFLALHVAEDLFLDYKHGNELRDPGKASRTMRQYLSGFANSSGGTLIIGVDESTWRVTGCAAPGGGDLAEWASRCLTPIASYFSPPPRFQVVAHPNGNVLIAATERSLGLVPCVEAGKQVYYLRIHDQMMSAPEYLVADLILGKRQRPHLIIAGLALSNYGIQQDQQIDLCRLVFELQLVCENESLSWTDEMRLGVVSWDGHPGSSQLISSQLRSYIDIEEPDTMERCGQHFLTHDIRNHGELAPFFPVSLGPYLQYSIPLRSYSHWHTPYTWKAAAYLTTKGTLPIWYQISLTVCSELLDLVRDSHREPLPLQSPFAQFKRLSGERPVVAWDGISPMPLVPGPS